MNNNFNFIKVAAAVPELRVADCEFNVNKMIELVKKANKENVKIISFPELSITGYTCADLFHQTILIKSAEKELSRLIAETSTMDMFIVVGMPINIQNQKLNCAVVIKEGTILGVVPKTYLPNYGEFYEKRWFVSGANVTVEKIKLCYQDVPLNTNIIFQDERNPDIAIGIEICEDLWTVIPPSSYHVLNGATIIINPSASNELIGKYEYRKNLVEQQSARTNCGYIYSSAGTGESTTDVVFSGSAMIVENGNLLVESNRFSLESELIISEIDVEYLMNNRMKNTGFTESLSMLGDIKKYQTVYFKFEKEQNFKLTRIVNPLPFVPTNSISMNQRCEEILNIQSHGLIKRLQHIGTKKTIIGISGGLDSALALLVQILAYDKLGIPRKNIIGVTMPGFGTTDRTYHNAIKLMDLLGITRYEVSIKEACLQHFKDIGVESNVHDLTYENSQARERTQILMDIATKEKGFVIGTGDLSELALGWCTYNGDHMSMYAVNTSIPKTLVKHLVHWKASQMLNSTIENDKQAAKILIDIVETPVSPELLPPNKDGEINQKTEEIVGNYDLNDFFLFNVMKCGFSPKKIFFLAQQAFQDKYDNEYIRKYLKVFYERFFSQQFKRNCLPDGVKVGSVSISPRGDWRMPSDAVATVWLNEVRDIGLNHNHN